MKIGIVTVQDSSNFGSYLQAYGIKSVIEESGNQAYFIKNRSRLSTFMLFLDYNNTTGIKGFISLLKHYVRFPKNFVSKIKKYKRYKRDWEHFNTISLKSLEKQPMDIVLFGSDEIWNVRKPVFRKPIFYGVNVPAKRKIAYAVSIGDMRKEDWKPYDFIPQAIKSFEQIYTRDAATEEVLEAYGFHVNSFICDPTIQMDIRKHMRPSSSSQIPSEPFILIYSYDIQPIMIEHIKKFALENGLKTASISLFQSWCDEHIECSPLEFGFVLSKASYVYTTTFHGTIFSVLYHTKFAVKPISPKVNDVLQRFGISNATIPEDPTYEEFRDTLKANKDYDVVEKNILKLREDALRIFRRILNTNDEERGSFLVNRKTIDCSGCGACAQVCPENCIEMKADEKGFLYPITDKDLCIDCGLCFKVCPMDKSTDQNKDFAPGFYACVHKDKDILMRSSSGGAFTALSQAFCDENYAIFGVGLNDEVEAEHSYIEDISEINIFRKSKYVQSNTLNTFNQVKAFLKIGKKVLYSGTPCQIAGLSRFLGKPYENLLLVEILCHGVASPKVLGEYIKYIEHEKGQEVTAIDFRNKIPFRDDIWKLTDCMVTLRDGTKQSDESTNVYTNCYMQNRGYRDSCYECKFARLPRVADITIGDCWGIHELREGMFEKKGVSLIIVNNDNGKKIFNRIPEIMVIEEITENEAICGRENPNIYRSTYKKDKESKFWAKMKKQPVEKVLSSFVEPPLSEKIKLKILTVIIKVTPKSFRVFVKKCLKR